MAATRNWTTTEDKQLRALHESGLTLSECAIRLGRSKAGVSTHSGALGLSWDRSKTKTATAARVADNRSRRSALETKLLAKADDLINKIDAPFLAFNFGGKDNTYEEHLLEHAPTIDIKNLMASAGIAIDRSLKIAVHDSDSSHDDAKSMLTGLAAAMGLAFRAPPEGEATT